LPPVVTYSLLRFALFLVPFVVLVVVQVPVMWAVLIAFVVSSLVSIVVLSRQRDRVSTSIVERRERVKTTLAERTAAEDAWDDARRGTQDAAAEDGAAQDGRSPATAGEPAGPDEDPAGPPR
jgi:hypothetical protein